LHSQGIKHGDISPENIILDKKTDEIKLIGFNYSDSHTFGMSKFEEVMGSPMYMAPEIYKQSYDS